MAIIEYVFHDWEFKDIEIHVKVDTNSWLGPMPEFEYERWARHRVKQMMGSEDLHLLTKKGGE